MNKKFLTLGLVCVLAISTLTLSVTMALKGENNMATISTINNGDSGATVRSAINTNFSNLNTEHGDLSTLTTTSKTNFVGAINELDAEKVQSIYGEMRDTGFTPKEVVLTTAGTFYPLAAGLSAGETSGITYGTSDLNILTSGRYLVTYNCSVSTSSSVSITAGIIKNSSVVSGTKMTSYCPSTELRHISCSAILNLTAADVIEIGFSKNSAISTLFYVYYVNVTITKV